MKRIIALALVCLLIGGLTSCGGVKDDTPACLTLGDCKITEAMYNYFASSYKYQYIRDYDDVTNNNDCYDNVTDNGQTIGEYLDNFTLNNVKMTLASMKLFDDYGLKMPKSQEQSINDYISDLIKEGANGNREMLNQLLKGYGINVDLLKYIYTQEAKQSILQEYLYGENGAEKLSNDDYEKYYRDNYVHFQIIFINNKYQYVLDENGNYVAGDDGFYLTEDLSPSLKHEKDNIIATVKSELNKGTSFEKLYDKYSEIKSYKNGYYYSLTASYTDMMYYQLVNACNELDTNETRVCEFDTGTCIIKRLTLDDGGWNEEANADFFTNFKNTVQENALYDKLNEAENDIVVDEAIVSKYTIKNVVPCNY